MAHAAALLDSLPNEILHAILANLPTQTLPSLAPLSHRFHNVISQILKLRLFRTADLDHHEMILECYHPSERLTSPTLPCLPTHITTLGNLPIKDCSGIVDLGRLYSRFSPVRQGTHVPGRLDLDELPTQDIFLDDSELFVQLLATTCLVREGPRMNLFINHVTVGDGVIRVWREWLASRSEGSGCAVHTDTKGESRGDDRDILWADPDRNVGIRFDVVAKTDDDAGLRERHVFVSSDEPPVEYTLSFKELLVRTSRILHALEGSSVREIANSGFMTSDGRRNVQVVAYNLAIPPKPWITVA